MVSANGKTLRDLSVMGITTDEFAKVSWFRDDLLDNHIHEYMNLLALAPKGILLSSNVRDYYEIEVGDTLSISYRDLGKTPCMVYGFIDYFPGYQPFDSDGNPVFVGLVNNVYLETMLPAHPYEIWIDKKDGVSDQVFTDTLIASGLQTESIRFRDQAIIEKKNDPLLLGTNGTLTMCFIIEMTISAIGFLIFGCWLLGRGGLSSVSSEPLVCLFYILA